MKPDFDRDIEIFTEAVQLPPGEREAFLTRACAGDEELRLRIETLIKSNDSARSFLDQPVGTIGGGTGRIAPWEKPGDMVDRYKLLKQIGEGGCGVVFIAEQEQPVRRRVALKVIKPGMDTKSVIARFEAERQALALMDHPNIAQVYDAGTTAHGRPYFVMELVEGSKITEYCDRHSLPTEARLELFVQVCDAIQHAHQKGVIHRDIKPSNVLVATAPDEKPILKVIDFGIAKATGGQRLTDKTIFTAQEMLIGTPAYMSPEQATLSSKDVDTRTDIYSLGVLLYELLTGLTPFDTHELLKAGFDEMRRVIREEEPMRPSTRLCTVATADPSRASKQLVARVPKLIREMQGELDWIVMKALEKDRERRYATANGLAMDIERYVSGEAVLARPPSRIYKFRKLVTRNKLVFSFVALTFALLVTSLIATTRWLVIERRAHEEARKRVEMARLEDLGWDLGAQGKFEEAEQALYGALALRRQLPKGEITSVLAFNTMVQMFYDDKRFDRISPFLSESVDPALLSRAQYKALFNDAIGTLTRYGLWSDADVLVEELRKSTPNDPSLYHMRAPLLVAKNDLEGYRLLCGQIISRFSHATDPYVADQMAKDCLILPSSGADPKAIEALADFAVTRGRKEGAFDFFECTKALAEYRDGHFSDATNWAGRATKSGFINARAEALAVLSMSECELGDTNNARTNLDNCGRIIRDKQPKLGSDDLGQNWRDWIIGHALYNEANALVNPGKP